MAMGDGGDQRRVLLVDDEPAIAASLELAFDDEGWEVTTASSGEEAMELFAPGRFDVVVTDKNLPEMTGVEVVREMRALDGAVAIMMLTGYPSKRSAIDTLNFGVDAYVEKPVRDVFRLTARARTIIKRKAKKRAAQTPAAVPDAPSPKTVEAAAPSSLAALLLCSDASKCAALESDLERRVEHRDIADSWDRAKTALEQRAYQLVILDEGVPGFLQIVRELRATHADTMLVVVGQSIELDGVMTLIELGASGFIKSAPGTPMCTERIYEITTGLRRRLGLG